MSQHTLHRTTEVSNLSLNDPKACKKLIIDSLWNNAGNVHHTARALGISRPFLWHLLRKHDLRRVPTEVREEFQKRYAVFEEKK